MVLPRTDSDTRTAASNSNVQRTNFSQQEARTTLEHMNNKPISDQEAFFVEVSVPPAHTETPESVDTENCSFSAQSNFSQKEAQFGAIRPHNLSRGDHLALAR